MRPVRAVLLSTGVMTLLGCDLAGPGGGGEVTYQGAVTGQWVENSTHRGPTGVVQNCSHTYDLTIDIEVKMSESANTAEGDANVQIAAVARGSSNPSCGGGSSLNTGGRWTAQLTGTKADLRFATSRCSNDSTPPACSGTGFVQLTGFTFVGAEQGGMVRGTLTVTRTGSGITGGTTQSTSTGTGSYQVTLEEDR